PVPDDRFYSGKTQEPRPTANRRLGAGGQISTSKDPLLTRFNDLAPAGGMREYGQFLVEGVTLVHRAIHDGLPLDSIVYTADLKRIPEGVLLLSDARLAGIDHYVVTEGLMGRITSTRPVPAVAGVVCVAAREAAHFK